MGLDMYLKKREYVSWCDFNKKDYKGKAKLTFEVEFSDGTKETEVFEPITDDTYGMEIILPVAYWRKANAIHRWFIENFAGGVDDCQPIPVAGDDLIKLRDLCKEILEDKSKAGSLLPAQAGFFFGSTEYDDWYFECLSRTVKMLKDVQPDGDYEYCASW